MDPGASLTSRSLADFLEHLRAEGFDVGVGTWLQVSHLLSLMEPADVARAKRILGPVLARNRAQQEHVYREFDRFFPELAEDQAERGGGGRRRARRRGGAGGGFGEAGPPTDAAPGPVLTGGEGEHIPEGAAPGPAEPDAPGDGRSRRGPVGRWAVRVALAVAGVVVAAAMWLALRPGPRPGLPDVPGYAFWTTELDASVFETGGWSLAAALDTGVARVEDGAVRFVRSGVARFELTQEGWVDTVAIRSLSPEVGAIQLAAPDTLRVGSVTGLSYELVSVEGVPLPDDVPASPPTATSSDPSVAVVEAGTVVGLAPGTAEITVEAGFGLRESVPVVVLPPAAPERIVLAPVDGRPVVDGRLTLARGVTVRVGASVLDEDGGRVRGATVAWGSEDPDVASISTDGRLTVGNTGTATIRAMYGELTAEVAVVVTPLEALPARLEVRPMRLGLVVGSSAPLSVTVMDGGGRPYGEAGAVAWSTSDTSVVEVSDGPEGPRLVARGPGRATVAVVDGQGLSGEATAVVEDRPLAATLAEELRGMGLHLALPLAAFLLALWVLWRSGLLGARRERNRKGPAVYPVRPPPGRTPYPPSLALAGAARLMQRREASDTRFLDLRETVHATIESGGWPTFVWGSGTRPPEYLVLLERLTYRDHQPRLYHELVAKLEDFGVHVAEFTYAGDPRVVDDARTAARSRLVDLARRYPAHRVILFGSGDRLLHPVTGRLNAWVEPFFPWTDRAVLTPVPATSWGAREVSLAQRFMVLPATLRGLTALIAHFEVERKPDLRLWHRASDEPRPPDVSRGDPLPALRAYLGEPTFRWLTALAVYPELHWNLTLYIGSLPALGGGLVTERNLLRLVRLPWFREGFIEPEARRKLRAACPPAVLEAVQTELFRILESDPPPPDSIAADRYNLHLVVQELESGTSDAEAVRRLESRLRKIPPELLSGDQVILRFLEESDEEDALELHPRLRRRLRRYAFGRERVRRSFARSAAAFVGLALAGGAALWGASILEGRAWAGSLDREPVVIPSRSGGAFTDMSSDGFVRFGLRERGGVQGLTTARVRRFETAQSQLLGDDGTAVHFFPREGLWMPWRWVVGFDDGSVVAGPGTGEGLPASAAPVGAVVVLGGDEGGAGLAVGREDGTVEVSWEGRRWTLPGDGAPIRSLSASRDGRRLAVLDADGTLLVWEAGVDGPAAEALSRVPGLVAAARIHPDGTRVLVVDVDGELTERNAETGEVLERLVDASARGDAAGRSAASLSGEPLESLGGEGQAVGELPGLGESVLAYRPDGDAFAVLGPLGEAMVGTRAADGGVDWSVYLQSSTVTAVAFDPGSDEVFATGAVDGTVSIWRQSEDRTPLRTIEAHWGPVRTLSWTPDGSALLTTGEDGRAMLWSAPTGRALGTLAGPADTDVDDAGAPAATAAAVAGSSALPRCDGRVALAGDAAGVSAESPDGRYRAVAGDEPGTVQVSRRSGADSFRPYTTLVAGARPLQALLFNCDGTLLLGLDGGSAAFAWSLEP